MDGNINFSSVSSDGRVVTWQLVKNELQHQDTVQLVIPDSKVQGPEGTYNMAISMLTSSITIGVYFSLYDYRLRYSDRVQPDG